MCCRINSSSPYSRVINGLLIFLGTFLVGFLAVQAIWWFEGLIVSQSESADLRSAVEGPKESACYDNEDGITLIRWLGGPYKEHERQIRITNDGHEPIYYSIASLIVESYAPNAGSREYTRYYSEPDDPQFDTTGRVIKPHDSTDFWLPPNEDNAMNVTFRYRIDEARAWRSITVYFPQGSRFGDGCNYHF